MTKRGSVYIDTDDIIGKRVGKLEVTKYCNHNYDNTLGGDRMRHYYEVRCECGTVKRVRRGQLVNEIVHSCGCLKRGRKRNGD